MDQKKVTKQSIQVQKSLYQLCRPFYIWFHNTVLLKFFPTPFFEILEVDLQKGIQKRKTSWFWKNSSWKAKQIFLPIRQARRNCSKHIIYFNIPIYKIWSWMTIFKIKIDCNSVIYLFRQNSGETLFLFLRLWQHRIASLFENSRLWQHRVARLFENRSDLGTVFRFNQDRLRMLLLNIGLTLKKQR